MNQKTNVEASGLELAGTKTREDIAQGCFAYHDPSGVENVDVGAIIIGLLKSNREQTCLEALHFVFDRVIGKPKQDLNFSGGIVHTHTRDPILASLPKEALEALAQSCNEIIEKYATPVLDVARAGCPHNQTKSDAATRALEVEYVEAETS